MTAAKTDALSDQVILHHTPTWWIAEFRGSIAGQLRASCGTDTVTTGFNGHIPGSVVCTAIALLNPNAEVLLAEPAAEVPVNRPARPASTPETPAAAPAARTPAHAFWKACFSRATQKAASADPALGLAAEVVGEHRQATKPQKTGAERVVIERATKLKRTLGLMVACSYLKEQGWSFEAAHRALLQGAAQPRR